RPKAGDPNTRRYREVIDTFDGGLEPREIKATRDPSHLLFTSMGDREKGFHTITVTNNDPNNFQVDVGTVDLHLNKEKIGVRSAGVPGPDGYDLGVFSTKLTQQVFDLDIRFPSGIAVTSDLAYAFVGDYDISRYLTMDPMTAMEIEELHNTGGKIGIIADPF